MELYYKNTKTEKLCIDNKFAIKKLGSDVGIKLGYLLSLLQQANCFYDIYNLPQYRVHKLTADRINQYSLTISKTSPYRLIVYPLDREQNILKSNDNEKEMLIKAVAIEILEVVDYHD